MGNCFFVFTIGNYSGMVLNVFAQIYSINQGGNLFVNFCFLQ